MTKLLSLLEGGLLLCPAGKGTLTLRLVTNGVQQICSRQNNLILKELSVLKMVTPGLENPQHLHVCEGGTIPVNLERLKNHDSKPRGGLKIKNKIK